MPLRNRLFVLQYQIKGGPFLIISLFLNLNHIKNFLFYRLLTPNITKSNLDHFSKIEGRLLRSRRGTSLNKPFLLNIFLGGSERGTGLSPNPPPSFSW